MAFDGIVMMALIDELKEKILNLKIEKIYQPNKNEILITLRGKEKFKLFISVANNPRINLTEKNFENPVQAPTFCMVLRKHLQGGLVKDIRQFKTDRIFYLDVLSKNELGDEVLKTLTVEIMGKYSNIILTENNKIIDSIKRIPLSLSRVRQILPGLIYSEDPISSKLDPRTISKEDFKILFEKDQTSKAFKKFFMNNFTGISPLIARELCLILKVDEDAPKNAISYNDNFYDAFINFYKNLKPFKAREIYVDKKLFDYTAFEPLSYKGQEMVAFNSISNLIEEFSDKKYENSISNELENELKKLVEKNLNRQVSKLEKLNFEMEEAKNRDIYKVYGDLISSNFYRIENNIKEISLENFYDNMKPIKIPLDQKLNPQLNAQKYYKKFQKLKNREIFLKDQIENTKSSIEYLKSVLLNISLCENSSELKEIHEELKETGYINKKANKKIKKSSILEFKTDDGFTILVGKNNRQNEELTFKIATRDSLWFHVQASTGSHVLIKYDGRNYSVNAIEKAAQLAKKFSSEKFSNNVPVDYTLKKFVKRHPAKIPGLVLYTDFKTIIVK